MYLQIPRSLPYACAESQHVLTTSEEVAKPVDNWATKSSTVSLELGEYFQYLSFQCECLVHSLLGTGGEAYIPPTHPNYTAKLKIKKVDLSFNSDCQISLTSNLLAESSISMWVFVHGERGSIYGWFGKKALREILRKKGSKQEGYNFK